MIKNIAYYAVAIVLFVLLKFWFSTLQTDELLFLLAPISKILELSTGELSVYSSEHGFYYDRFNIVIDKSCSGYNYLLICFMVFYFQTVGHVKSTRCKILLVPVSLMLSYVLTIFVNSSRILVLLVSQDKISSLLHLDLRIVHEAIGVVTYLLFLIISYLATEKILNKQHAKPSQS